LRHRRNNAAGIAEIPRGKSLSGMDEAELARLLRAALGGDERAYAAFLAAAARLVRGFARGRVGGHGLDPEDVVQETLLALHVKRHTWKPDRPVTPWLYAIARYKLIDAYRRRGRRIDVDIDEVAETLAAPEPDRPSGREIGKALAALAPGQRSVVSAISVEGRSIGETAASLGMSETAVRVALHRGLAAIARKFGRS
jgi:RNA polymerase sigma-70 factor (ECF subfamily)